MYFLFGHLPIATAKESQQTQTRRQKMHDTLLNCSIFFGCNDRQFHFTYLTSHITIYYVNDLLLKSNTNVTIGGNPMVLLPLDIYEKITKSLGKLNSKNLLADMKKGSILAVASESSLSKDWLKKEEEKAWQNL